MQIHAEIRTLPPGIALAAQRRSHSGREVIVVAVAEDIADVTGVVERQGLLDLFCQAVNALWDAPEQRGPVTMPLAS